MNLFDDFTLEENLAFHVRFKTMRMDATPLALAQRMGLAPHLQKQLRFFSSGMKQRLKLGTAILSNTPLLLLDEPCSHLDASAIAWYQELLREHAGDRIVVIASNRQESETQLCNCQLLIDN